MKINIYPAIIEKDIDTDYGVSFPDFPGCVSVGVTARHAWLKAHGALQFHVDSMIEEGYPIPDASELGDMVPVVVYISG